MQEIPWRGALDWRHLSAFLSRRAIAGVETVEANGYRRGSVTVRRDPRRRRFIVTGGDEETPRRVRHLFDVDANSALIAAHLQRDRLLAPLVRRHRGIRLPGGWDPFEIVIRAIVGQQISVAAARSLLGALVEGCGERRNGALAFPTPERLATAPLHLGMPRRRFEAIRTAASHVAAGFALERGPTLEQTIAHLRDLPGVGPWTAHYIAMRAHGEADAFPAGDLVLRRAAGNLTEKELLRRAERWRPWRAYAAVLLWAG